MDKMYLDDLKAPRDVCETDRHEVRRVCLRSQRQRGGTVPAWQFPPLLLVLMIEILEFCGGEATCFYFFLFIYVFVVFSIKGVRPRATKQKRERKKIVLCLFE